MTVKNAKLILCSCEDTMPLAPERVGAGLPGISISTARHLCGAEQGRFQEIAKAGDVTVACTAMQSLFEDLAEDLGLGGTLTFVDVRSTAGWSSEAKSAAPKMAALIAGASVRAEPPGQVTLKSDGVTLIYGRDQTVIDIAERLKDQLDLTVVLMPGSDVVPPRHATYPIRQGRVRAAKGHLGAFSITLDAVALPAPSSRSRLAFGAAQDGQESATDIMIDVSGTAALFPAHDLRDGYLRADPRAAADVDAVVAQAADLVGTFDKPRYVNFTASLCAHQRSRIVGCRRCLDLCPTGAISSAGNSVAIDAQICAGCGQCAAACPTGAAAYAVPTVDSSLTQLRVMLNAYRAAGGRNAQILIHDGPHGDALIDAAARFGDGLPARAIPLRVNETTQMGLEFFAAAFAYGAASVHVLARAKPKHDLAGLHATIETAQTLLIALGYGHNLVDTIETDDPEDLVKRLRASQIGVAVAKPASFQAAGGKRDILKTALRELHRAAPAPVDIVAMPKDAAFGRVNVKVDGCTLCLACVSACPTRALGDATDRPLLSFDEALCVQCGLCAATCPEKVITLEPRMSFGAFEAGPAVIKEEEPFCCTSCGKAFGVKSTIERVIKRLEDQHWMFTGANKTRVDLIRMCEDCRVEAAVNSSVDPFAGPARPHAKTSEDYFKAREAEMLKKIDKGEA